MGWVRTLARILSEQKGYDDISAGFVSEDTSRGPWAILRRLASGDYLVSPDKVGSVQNRTRFSLILFRASIAIFARVLNDIKCQRARTEGLLVNPRCASVRDELRCFASKVIRITRFGFAAGCEEVALPRRKLVDLGSGYALVRLRADDFLAEGRAQSIGGQSLRQG